MSFRCHLVVTRTTPIKRMFDAVSARQSMNKKGFTLLEMLAVITVIGLLAALSMPAISSISNSAGRKGAVNVLLNTFEQARVAALETGGTVYVGFADSQFPVESQRYRAFIVFRPRGDDEPGTNNYIALTKWISLPDRIYFKSERLSLVGDGTSAPYPLPLSDSSIPRLTPGKSLPVISFNSTGAVSQPTNSSNLFLFITEYDKSHEMGGVSGGLYEKISFSRFTGRAQLDVTTLQ